MVVIRKGIALSICCVLLHCGCCVALQESLRDEIGFEGAVTVLSIEKDGACNVALVRIPYLDIYGKAQEGRARLIIECDRIRTEKTLPVFCHVHYEMSVDSARKWAKRGWAVFTAVYNEDAPIAVSPGDGNNLARAIIQWARRCSFVDAARLHLDGGSQGGYMALAMSAAMFPVTSATADVPVVNWAYNFNYFEKNRPLMAGFEHTFESPLPVMASVLPLADMAYEHFGNNLADDTWYYISPISKIQYINNPVLVTVSTGDILVPMEQFSHKHIPDCTFEEFPEGYQRDFDTLTLNEKARVRLEDLLPEGQVFTHVQPLQNNSYIITLDMRLGTEKHPPLKPELSDRTWSPEHQWNLYYLDEGCVLPFSDHFTYAWNTSPDTFVAHYQDMFPSPEILTDQKLLHILKRYENSMSELPLLKNGNPVNRRNFDYVERHDVISGLLDYATMGKPHETRLLTLYADCPRKPFGTDITLESLREMLNNLQIPTHAS
ncbi:MAG: hypothetical protein KAH38_00990 [Candidatus Hydrogenedentes bacterium]|nr:hypothetical protein [Candidatus Hydrogenedentota bacterium]